VIVRAVELIETVHFSTETGTSGGSAGYQDPLQELASGTMVGSDLTNIVKK
jgi:hypothetical protein